MANNDYNPIKHVKFSEVDYFQPTTHGGGSNKPLKEVWAVYQDEGKMKDWLEGFESIELVKGNRNDIGSEYIVKMNQEGQTFEIKETLKSYKEFENINFDFSF